jgi:hypothetical protein
MRLGSGDASLWRCAGISDWRAVIHHIPDRLRLCARIARALRSGVGCYIEDLCLKQPISGQDLNDVRHVLFGMSVTGIDEFLGDLKNSGLVDVVASDLSPEVTPFVMARLASWQTEAASHRQQLETKPMLPWRTSSCGRSAVCGRQDRLCSPECEEPCVTALASVVRPFVLHYVPNGQGLTSGGIGEWRSSVTSKAFGAIL